MCKWLSKWFKSAPKGTRVECHCGHVDYYDARLGQAVICKACHNFLRLPQPPARPAPRDNKESLERFIVDMRYALDNEWCDEATVHVCGHCSHCNKFGFWILRDGRSSCCGNGRIPSIKEYRKYAERAKALKR